MRTPVLIFGLVLAAFGFTGVPAFAQAIAPMDVRTHVGQTVTVEGSVSDVHTARSGVTYIDMGGRYPDNAFTAVIFKADTAKFPNVTALSGKLVDITGRVRLYRGKPEIIVQATDQIKVK